MFPWKTSLSLVLMLVAGINGFNQLDYSTRFEKRETSAPINSPGVDYMASPIRPYFDLVVAVFLAGGHSEEAKREEKIVRAAYKRYQNGGIVLPGTKPNITFTTVFVVGKHGLPEGTAVPAKGLLRGDTFFLDIPEGYSHLGDKTKGLMALVEHLRSELPLPLFFGWK